MRQSTSKRPAMPPSTPFPDASFRRLGDLLTTEHVADSDRRPRTASNPLPGSYLLNQTCSGAE